MSKQYKLYRVECAEDSTPIDKEDNPIGISNLEYTSHEYYMVEIWNDGYHYADHKEFKTLAEAVKFIEGEENENEQISNNLYARPNLRYGG